MEQFTTLLWSLVGIVTTGLISWLTSLLISWLNAKIKNTKMAAHATAVATIIMNAVQVIAQTFVDTLKKNGKFDETAQIEAKEKALEIINTQLTDELRKYIEENFGEVQTYIGQQIEVMLYNLKH